MDRIKVKKKDYENRILTYELEYKQKCEGNIEIRLESDHNGGDMRYVISFARHRNSHIIVGDEIREDLRVFFERPVEDGGRTRFTRHYVKCRAGKNGLLVSVNPDCILDEDRSGYEDGKVVVFFTSAR